MAWLSRVLPVPLQPARSTACRGANLHMKDRCSIEACSIACCGQDLSITHCLDADRARLCKAGRRFIQGWLHCAGTRASCASLVRALKCHKDPDSQLHQLCKEFRHQTAHAFARPHAHIGTNDLQNCAAAAASAFRSTEHVFSWWIAAGALTWLERQARPRGAGCRWR